MTATKIKLKKQPKSKALPPTALNSGAAKKSKAEKPAKLHKFQVGDAVEFHLREGEPRAVGDAVVIKIEPLPRGSYMAQLDVKRVVAGKPDAIRNPDGELWAEADELFKPGTRDALQVTGSAPEAKPAKGLPEGFSDAKAATGGAVLLFRHERTHRA